MPDAPMTLFIGEPAAVRSAVTDAKAKAESAGKKVGMIDFNGDAEAAARLFFKKLREFDSQKVDVIFAAGVKEEGIGIAVMNRMRSAADGNVVEVS